MTDRPFVVFGDRGQGDMEVSVEDAVAALGFLKKHGIIRLDRESYGLHEDAPRSIAYGGGPYYQLLGTYAEDCVSLTEEMVDKLRRYCEEQNTEEVE